MDCIFCKIIKGEIPSYTIYEDEFVKAFLDVNPISEGHTLVIPKRHFENLYDIDLEGLKQVEQASKKVAERLKEKLNCAGITRMQNNEYGQEVKHYHMHLIPRYEKDGFDVKPAETEIARVLATFEKITK